MFVRFTCVFQHRTKRCNRCCKYYVLWAPMLGWCLSSKNDSHMYIRRSNRVYKHMQIYHLIRKFTKDWNERKGWPLGNAWAPEEKKRNRKKKPLWANCVSPRPLLHETLKLARDKKKKRVQEKMEIEGFGSVFTFSPRSTQFRPSDDSFGRFQ